ncbi:MAG TPA: flagellar biosynthesis protein FlhF, partial [Lacipirellulaceae bacterium]|nr:flagellar biosynthesis protein FlhF [Lacipirellulaceae bacterium]
MEIKTFRARTMTQALAMVREELGSEATVLHTRELHGSLLGRLLVGRQYEIAATPGRCDVRSYGYDRPAPQTLRTIGGVELDLHDAAHAADAADCPSRRASDTPNGASDRLNQSHGLRHAPYLGEPSSQHLDCDEGLTEVQALVDRLQRRASASVGEMPPALFNVFTDLIEADVEEQTARQLTEQLRSQTLLDMGNALAIRARLAHLLEEELQVSGPIAVQPGAGRVVALIGPTGVGKTTTIAKLAANFRLREQRRVGLITVDTYRIAAVEQLRTYADIIDLPMEVVSTPREMREAVQRLRSLDLILMDTAGRSPRDEVKIQELRSLLAEAAPDEVHLVLSAAASARSLA